MDITTLLNEFLFSLAYDYKIMIRAECSMIGGISPSRSEAEESCSKNKNCTGLLDQECNNNGEYYLCLRNETIKYNDDSSSCIYLKQIIGRES